MNKNFWGEPDDDVDMPDWMRASTHQNKMPFKGIHNKSLEQAAAEALKKPAIPVLLKAPTEDDLK